MHLTQLLHKAERIVRSNSPAILTAFGVTGTVSTGYLAVKSGIEHAEMLTSDERASLSKRSQAEIVWRVYIPPVVSGAFTIGCIIGAAKAGSRRTAAITAAYSLSDKAFNEYRDKVVEVLGANKDQKIRDQIAQDRVTNSPPKEGSIIVTNGGGVLCCELYTGRYFQSDMETLRKVQNDINAKIIHHGEATLSDFYYDIGLPGTANSGDVGWEEKLMELEFSTVLSEDNKPCLAFTYNYIAVF